MRFSIIVPVYNGEEYLPQTLDCLLAQSEKDIEIIAVNDGSTDSTQNIIESYAQKDGRIKAVYQENAGVSAARNNGIEKACGEYLFFLDSDDLIEPDVLEKMYGALERTGAQLGLCRVRTFGFGSEEFNQLVDELVQNEKISCYDKRLLRNFIPVNKFYRTKALKDSGVRFPSTRYSEDGAFLMEFIHAVKPEITGVYDAVAKYRKHPNSVTSRVNSSYFKDYSLSMDSVYNCALNSFEDAPELKEDYLQEILFKDGLALMNEFYRMLWRSEDEEALVLMKARYDSLITRMNEQARHRLAKEIKDIGKPVFSKAEIAENPFISIKVKDPSEEFLRSVKYQSMPLFEIVDSSAKPKGKITLSFKGNEKLDPRLFKVVSLLKRSPKFGFLPDSLIKFGAGIFLKLKR